jgi:hypothetical protein
MKEDTSKIQKLAAEEVGIQAQPEEGIAHK